MSQFETETYILPAYWASAIINGDTSGLEDSEIKELDDWFELNNQPNIVDCSNEPHFSHSNDAGTLAGDVLEYTALIERS
jgi:hypothetical protein